MPGGTRGPEAREQHLPFVLCVLRLTVETNADNHRSTARIPRLFPLERTMRAMRYRCGQHERLARRGSGMRPRRTSAVLLGGVEAWRAGRRLWATRLPAGERLQIATMHHRITRGTQEQTGGSNDLSVRGQGKARRQIQSTATCIGLLEVRVGAKHGDT